MFEGSMYQNFFMCTGFRNMGSQANWGSGAHKRETNTNSEGDEHNIKQTRRPAPGTSKPLSCFPDRQTGRQTLHKVKVAPSGTRKVKGSKVRGVNDICSVREETRPTLESQQGSSHWLQSCGSRKKGGVKWHYFQSPCELEWKSSPQWTCNFAISTG
jgi:hypothetical protein